MHTSAEEEKSNGGNSGLPVLTALYMEEKNIRNAGKDVKKNFLIALVLSVMLIAGVPMIILGATNKIWAVMGIGIAFTVLGFYGCPIGWVMYGEAKFRAALVSAVECEGRVTVDGLVAQFGKPRNKIVADIRKLIEKRYLAGYAFDGETLVYAEKKERPKERIYVGKCPSCNAVMEYSDGKVKCPYCGFVREATVEEIEKSG